MDNEYEEEMRHTTEKIKRIRRMREREIANKHSSCKSK